MAELKTKQTDADVHAFINSFAETEQRKRDSFELLKIMEEVTGINLKCGVRVSLASEATSISLSVVASKGNGHWLASLLGSRQFLYTYIWVEK